MNMTTVDSGSNQGTSLSLLDRVRHDDSKAWCELVDLYAPLVASWCHRRGFDHADTADLLQNIFLSVARGLPGFRHSKEREGSFRAWLWTISRNKIIDRARKQQKNQERPVGGSSNLHKLSDVPEEQFPDEDEPTSSNDLHQLVHRALDQIRGSVAPQTWQAFWRTVVDGQSTDVVASELGMQPAAIRQSRSRVLRRLREQMGDC